MTRSDPGQTGLSYHPALMSADRSSSELESIAIVNARVWTGDPRRPWADGLAVRGDRPADLQSEIVQRRTGAGGRHRLGHRCLLARGGVGWRLAATSPRVRHGVTTLLRLRVPAR